MTAAMSFPAVASSRPNTRIVCLGFRPRQRLDRDVGHDGERAPGASQKLAEVVAGNVLHHAAAGFERLAASGNRAEAKEMVAGGAGLDAPWAGEVRRECATDRAAVGRNAQKRTIVHRLEGKLLTVSRDQRLDLGKRRARPRRQYELGGLVEGDSGKPGNVERGVPLRCAADHALAAAADNFQRLAAADRPIDGLFHLRRIARFKMLGHAARYIKTAADRGTPRGPRARACGRARRSDAASEIPCPD